MNCLILDGLTMRSVIPQLGHLMVSTKSINDRYSNIKVNQYTDLHVSHSTQPEPSTQASTSTQPQIVASMPTFAYDLNYCTTFDPSMAPPNTGGMQDYFGYIIDSSYHLQLNQQHKMQAKVVFLNKKNAS
jgi:hypothetical protein